MRAAKEKAVKAALLKAMRDSGVDPREIAEWLWEDYGVRVKPRWPDIERAVLKERDVTAQDLAVLMIDLGLQPDEGAWDAAPRPSMRGGKAGEGGG